MSYRFLLLVLAASVGWSAEIRGAWVARPSLTSRDEIRTTVQRLAAANFNCVFVNVWSRGYPIWPSKVFEEETGILIDPTYKERDPLQETIEEAHAAGLTVIPWVEYGFAAGLKGYFAGEGGKGPIFDRHPDWLARTQSGDDAFVNPSGTFYYMVHTRPEVHEFLIRLMQELTQSYDVPAIQFDRARYPQLDCGYDDYTRELYASEHDGRQPPDNVNDREWLDWRTARINRFVLELHRRIKAADWRMLVTNAPGPYRYNYLTYAQDYTAWMREGSLDFATPQVYRNTAADYARELDAQIAAVPERTRLVPGVNAPADPRELVKMVEYTRARGLPGVVIWYYGSLVSTNALDLLKETVFEQKAPLPWR